LDRFTFFHINYNELCSFMGNFLMLVKKILIPSG
jgi:hypothetical protein